MEKIFLNCNALTLPDISKWDLRKVENIKDNFSSSSDISSEKIIFNNSSALL